MTSTLRRAAAAAAIIAAPLLALPPASATPAGDDGHTVTICHVTNSPSNPFVVITVDVAAFDGDGGNDHTHHMSKDGRVDTLALGGECAVTPPPGPEPTPAPTPEP